MTSLDFGLNQEEHFYLKKLVEEQSLLKVVVQVGEVLEGEDHLKRKEKTSQHIKGKKKEKKRERKKRKKKEKEKRERKKKT